MMGYTEVRSTEKGVIRVIKKADKKEPTAYLESPSGALYLFGDADKTNTYLNKRGVLKTGAVTVSRADCCADNDTPVRIVGVIVEEV